MALLELIHNAPSVAMLGMCKNAGKTTAFNRLIREMEQSGRRGVALTSIGRDGEGLDLVTGTKKPPICLYEGMLAATAEQLLPLCDVSREILATTGLFTSLGEVVIFRAKSDGYVQLAGPAIVEHRLQLRAGASLDRDMAKVVEETAFAVRRLSLPKLPLPGPFHGRLTLYARQNTAPENTALNGVSAEYAAENAAAPGSVSAGNPPQQALLAAADSIEDLPRDGGARTLLVRGALTEPQARALLTGPCPKEGLTLLLRDAGCLLLKRATFAALLARGTAFAVEHPTRLAAVTANPVSAGGWCFEAARFLEEIRATVHVPVINTEA